MNPVWKQFGDAAPLGNQVSKNLSEIAYKHIKMKENVTYYFKNN